jgi:large subunit ribosomal protein L32
MPLPKRRHSHTRGAKRRTNWKLDSTSLATCPQCSQKKMPHHVCPHCGFYNGKQILPDDKIKS